MVPSNRVVNEAPTILNLEQSETVMLTPALHGQFSDGAGCRSRSHDDNQLVVVRSDLERGRASYVRESWQDAVESLSSADRLAPLAAEDLGLLANAAYLIGRDDDYVSGLERAHRGCLEAGDVPRAATSASRSPDPPGSRA
jgi:hypothetical protein